VLDARAATVAGSGRRPGGAPAPQAEGAGSVRVKLRIGFDNGRQIRAEAVILIIEGDEEPYRILSWQDDFDGPG
jgi:general secretion pathway protein K